MGRGDSPMLSAVMPSKEVLPDKARVSPWRVAPTVAFAGVVGGVLLRLRDLPDASGLFCVVAFGAGEVIGK
jgi:hypothetical protein